MRGATNYECPLEQGSQIRVASRLWLRQPRSRSGIQCSRAVRTAPLNSPGFVFLFFPRLFRKTIFSESHSGATVDSLGYKSRLHGFQGICNIVSSCCQGSNLSYPVNRSGMLDCKTCLLMGDPLAAGNLRHGPSSIGFKENSVQSSHRNLVFCRHLITLSALYSKDCGMVRPICFAVLRLITSSNFVGCSTGKSPGLAPFRILST